MERFAGSIAIPRITDLHSGLKLLASLSNDQIRMSGQLESFLDSLLKDPPAQPICFALLEKTRAPLAAAAETLARQYSNRFLPLDDFEELAFQVTTRLWRKMANAYSWCLKNQKEDTSREDHNGTVATLICRSLYYLGQIMYEHYRSRRELPIGIWPELHRRFLLAEQAGVTQTLVHDPLLPPEDRTHCAAIYTACLLVSLGTPYRLSIRDQELVQRWAVWWAPLVELTPVGADEEIPELAIDLRCDAGIKPCEDEENEQCEHLRRLDTSRLIKRMRNAHVKLQQNIPPLQIGLGDRCTPGRARRLLKILALPWSLQIRPRRFPRYPSRGAAHVASGFEDIHQLLSGQEFVSPTVKRQTAYEPQDSNLRLFAVNSLINSVQMAEMVPRASETPPVPADARGDPWKISNQSASGLCLRRPAPGKKVAHNQLLAVHTEGGNAHFLAYARWVLQAQQGHLIAGIAAFPGLPRAVAVRFPIDHAGHEELMYSRAFLLPASEALNIPAMLIMQHADYQAERVIEICTVNSEMVEQRLILKRVLHEGSDFEYVSFDPA